MISNIFFDHKHPALSQSSPKFWLYGAAVLTSGYLFFGLLLEGTRGLTRGGFLMAVASAAWLFIGIATRQAKFPLILLIPLAFFLMMVISGFQLSQYPTEYILRMVTIWVGAVAVSAFLANGVSLNLVILWLAIIVAANIAAIVLGYDSNIINTEDFSASDLGRVEIVRASGLASQQNVLTGIAFLLPFSLFFLRSRIPAVAFFAVCLSSIAITVYTGSRTGIIFTAVFMLFGAIFLIPKGGLRILVILIGGVAVVASGLFISDTNALSRIENSSLGEVVVVQRVISRIDNEDTSSIGRAEMKQSLGPLYAQKPFLGHGPGGFKEVSGFGMYAHDNFVEVAVNFGLVGLLIYYAMYLASLLGIVLAPDKNLYLFVPLLFLVLADNWFVTYVNRPMALCICILLALSFPGFKRKSRQRRRRRQVLRPT